MSQQFLNYYFSCIERKGFIELIISFCIQIKPVQMDRLYLLYVSKH